MPRFPAQQRAGKNRVEQDPGAEEPEHIAQAEPSTPPR
jgi:hypothetical protein